MNYYVRINPLNTSQVYVGRTKQHILARNHRDWADYHDNKLSKKLFKAYDDLYKADKDFNVVLLETTDNSEDFDFVEQKWIDLFKENHELLNATDKANSNKSKAIKVSCYDDCGNLVKTYDSKLQACLDLGINNTNLDKALKNEIKKTSGYMWRLGNSSCIEPYDGRMRRNTVYQFDKEGNFIKEYPSFQSAADAVGLSSSTSIHYAVSGKTKTAKGFIWKTTM